MPKPNSFQSQVCSAFSRIGCEHPNRLKCLAIVFCSKANNLHSPTMWAQSELGSFSSSPRFTDNFGITPEPFPALSTLDPELLYINWPRNCTGTYQSRNFRKHNRKTNSERHWIFRTKRLIRTSPNQILLNVNCADHFTALAVNMQSV